MNGRRIGVYVCHCGGNISDYVDVGAVVEAVKDEPDVVVVRDAMFTCSDLTQQEIIADIRAQELDGLVVASCSPKLHTFTFREMSRRAGLNPYEYTQVNLREQCSWTHTDDPEGATRKAIRLVRAGIASTRGSVALVPTVVQTTSRALVIGGGVTGMRASIGLADIGIEVVLVEEQESLGGRVGSLGPMFPHGVVGRELVSELRHEIEARPSITVLTEARVVAKSGTYGNYVATVEVAGGRRDVNVGQIVVATGSDVYQPVQPDLGYGTQGVLTLDEFEQLLDHGDGPLVLDGKVIASLAYIYCVGSRDAAHPYCSRFCCSAAVHASLRAASRSPELRQYHFYRDMRTYGRYEEMLSESRRHGSVYVKFADDAPPTVRADDGGLTVEASDLLTAGEQLSVPVDVVVLVTGMVPRHNDALVKVLKLPVGQDGFFNEIHPKLRPVETVVDGVTICGACQGPKTSAESVASGLAAVAQVSAVLSRGSAELDPQVATVDPRICTGCGECVGSCPFGAIKLSSADVGVSGRASAVVDPTGCKGCGACVPVCPVGAIDLSGYTDRQIRAMIDALASEVPT